MYLAWEYLSVAIPAILLYAALRSQVDVSSSSLLSPFLKKLMNFFCT